MKKRLIALYLGLIVLLVAPQARGTIVTRLDTNSNWQNGNMGFWDGVYNTNYKTTSMWTTCPILAIEQDPYTGGVWYREFNDWAIGNWAITTTGAGTETIDDGVGGYLLITNAAADDDSDELQHHAAVNSGECWTLVATRPLWFEAKLAIDDATESDLVVGLCITDTTLIDACVDGVFFQKDDDDVNIDYNSAEAGGAAAIDTDSGVDIVANQFFRYGIVWDGVSTVHFYIDGVHVGSDATDVPTTELTVSVALQNGEAVIKTMIIDYIKVVQLR